MAKGLIQELTLGIEIPSFGKSSNQEEWASRGKALFDARKYEDAARCYQHAGYAHLADIAWAYNLRQDAGTSTGNRRGNLLKQAAETFRRSAHHHNNEKYQLPFARLAADCFLQAGFVGKAVDALLSVKDYTQAALTLYEAGKIDDSVTLIQRYPDGVGQVVQEKIVAGAKETYFRNLAFS